MNNELEALSKRLSDLIFAFDDLDVKSKNRIEWILKILYEISASLSC